MKKIISSLMMSAVFSTSLLNMYPSASSAEETKTIRIMSIGDSITDGYGKAGSYRKFLYNDLVKQGYSIDMLGAKGGGWTPTYTDPVTGESFEYDDENTGYSGYTIQSYNGRNGIYELLVSTDCLSQAPDIVILQIGTNDVIDNHELDTSGERLTVLLEYILEHISPESSLFVTSIPELEPNQQEVYNWFSNYRHDLNDWNTTYTDDEVEVKVHYAVSKYNNIVQNTVSALKKKHNNIYLGDINSVITDVSTQLDDGVHPNDTGYKLMGDYWAKVLSDHLSGGEHIQDNNYTIADAVSLGNYLLNRKSSITSENWKRYDVDPDSVLNSFDIALMLRKMTKYDK